MLGATFLFQVMLPVEKPVAEVFDRLSVTGQEQFPRAHIGGFVEAALQTLSDRPFFNASPAVDLVYGMWIETATVAGPVLGFASALVIPSLTFPAQYSWLKAYFRAAIQTLSVVDLADAPAGNALRIVKAGVTYAVYLVDITDLNATPLRVQTTTGVKAIRIKT